MATLWEPSIDDLKKRIKELRAIRDKSETRSEELKKFRAELAKFGLTVFWCSEEQDYAIYCDEI